MTVWDLFVDETGDFELADAGVAVIGVLLRDPISIEPQLLKDWLRAAAPHFPWPIHATEMNLPILWSFNYLARGQSISLPAEWSSSGHPGASLGQLAGEVARAFPQETTGSGVMMQQVHHGKLDQKAFRLLNDRLRRTLPAVKNELDDYVRNAKVWIKTILEIVFEFDPDREDASPSERLLVSTESSAGDAISPRVARKSKIELATERYALLLESLIERVVDLLGQSGKDHVVHVRVLNRPWQRPGTLVKRATTISDVQQLIASVGFRDPRVRAVATEVTSYSGDLHPGFVLADHMANRLREPLVRISTLESLEQSAKAHCVFPFRSGDCALPHPSSTGQPRGLIESARLKRQVVFPAKQDCRGKTWAWEQAREWVKYFEEKR